MDISNLELNDAVDFTTYTDSNDSRIHYTFAKFRDPNSNTTKYGVRVTKYKSFEGGECEISKWSVVTEIEFYNVKNMKR